ncbi:MAG TPA: ABC transporter permease, partial [Cyclobacteriaceae bacterium]|nr:ABC transporter permease [Cyclobacteriaceae bacterium]
MLRNYIKVAFRALLKNWQFSLINIAGLAIGISICVLITLYVLDELSFDTFHLKADRIVRLTPTLHMPKGDRPRAITSPVMGPALQANFPEIEKIVRLTGSSRTIAYKDKKIYDTRVLYADSTFFDIFTFPMIAGNPKTALVNPYSIVLTQTSAKKYFSGEDPMGKIMAFSDSITLTVTGIMKDIPANSHIQFDVLLSHSTIWEMTDHHVDTEWFSNSEYTFLLLREGQDREKLESKFPAFLENVLGEEKKESGLWYDFYLQPIKDIHLRSDLAAEMGPNGSIKYVYTFSVIAILVLLVACANYVNLSTARSMKRAKELGMRKVIGARRFQLTTQLFGESLLLTTFSAILAIAIVTSALPAFNGLAGKQMTIESIFSFNTIIAILLIFLTISLLAGAYPALMMSSFSPIKTLKNNVRQGKENILIRKGLVIFQFTISIMLISGTIVIYQQMEFLQNQNLGLNKEQMIELKMRYSVNGKAKTIREEMLRVPGVRDAALTSFSYNNSINNIALHVEGSPEGTISSEASISIDENFLNAFQIPLAAGRNFSRDFPTDSASGFIVNETAVKHFDWGTPEEAIGKELDWGLGKKGRVVGVAKDFNFYSAHSQIRPVIMHIIPDWYEFVALKIDAAQAMQVLSRLEEKWNSMGLDSPFDYSFMDQDFEKLYKAEQQTQTVVTVLSSLAIFIACLGLFGLAAFTAEQRTKEIGVRKVLGADVVSVVKLLSSDFIKLVAIAIIFAIPISWIGLQKWLDSFAYRTEVSPWIFALAAVSAMTVALFTVSFQSIKAAMANPVIS